MSASKRLAAVLRIRQIQERGARGQLAVRRGEQRLAEEAEARTWADLDRRGAAKLRAPDVGAGAPALGGDHAVTEAGRLAAETQRGATAAASGRTTVALEAWTIAARRVEGMQRLADRVAAHDADERQRAAANEIDDLVLGRFGRSPSSTTPTGTTGAPR